MTPDPRDDPADAAALAAYATALADGVEAHLSGWVERVVAERYGQWTASTGLPDEIRATARAEGERATAAVAPRVRALLERDVDDQPTGPLALLRTATAHPTTVLRAAGVPPVRRDEVAARLHPDDVYDLSPASFADVHPDLHEPGLTWGAAKAHVVLARRRREGRR
ncbi:MAG TPA: hypothetical protein VF228_04045 [Iamia sp.]